jgi:hypothetical protein
MLSPEVEKHKFMPCTQIIIVVNGKKKTSKRKDACEAPYSVLCGFLHGLSP